MTDSENRPISPEQEDGPEAKSPAELLARIVATPETCFGKPRIDGTRFYVAAVLEYFAAGLTEDEILADFPFVTRSDLRACLLYAAEMTRVKLPPPVRADYGPVPRPDESDRADRDPVAGTAEALAA